MRIIMSGKNMEITQALKDYAEKKIKKLERYFNPGTEVHVTFSVERSHRHIVEVTIPFEGIIIRAEEATDDMYASIDSVLDKIERQIHKHKTKLEKKFRSGAFKYEKPLFSERIEEEREPKIVKTKRFALKPISIEEALMQMDLLGHSFFVFINADTEQVNVLYRRKDGNYGLIEPTYM